MCSMLDATRIWCDPSNHIYNGHALWHILTAIALFLYFQFYQQFAFDAGMEKDNNKKLLPVIVVDRERR